MLRGLKKFSKSQIILYLDYQKRNDHKVSHSSVKLISSDSDIDEAFKSFDQSIMTKIKNYASEDSIVLDVIIKHRFLSVSIRRKNSIKKWR